MTLMPSWRSCPRQRGAEKKEGPGPLWALAQTVRRRRYFPYTFALGLTREVLIVVGLVHFGPFDANFGGPHHGDSARPGV